MNEIEKRNLLLSAGIDPDTGRKIRSDKGTKRGPNSKIRSDKGFRRLRKERSKITVYLALKSRILSSTVYDETQPDYCLRIDENMLFIPMIKHNTVKQQNHMIVSKGLAKQRTCKHIQGYEIDLESYRFEALQELALSLPNELVSKSQYNIKFAAEVSQLTHLYSSFADKRTITWWDLFCLMYHISGEDVAKWSYQQWHQQYEIAQTYYNQTYGDDVPLPVDFTFEFGKQLGTDYWTEMLSVVQSVETTQINEIKASRDYLVYMAKVRDEAYEMFASKIRTSVYADPESASLSPAEIERVIRDKVMSQYGDRVSLLIEKRSNEYIQLIKGGETID